jgi:protein associated with RNAse G/E
VSASLAVAAPVKVRKLRPDGSEVFSWTGEVLRCDSDGIVLRALFNVDVVELGYTTFRRGDVFVEFYYWNRWYNVFQISEPDGTLKGWYANVGEPAELLVERSELSYVDLDLDVWSDPDGTITVLDEPEFVALLAERPELSEDAERGRAELLELAVNKRLPRWPA